ncbi:unnamed protein product, partial [Ectocarpus sp. 12 AP-2014]
QTATTLSRQQDYRRRPKDPRRPDGRKDFFARMPKLSMVAYDPAPPRIHGAFA